MAVAFDASTESHTGTTGSASEASFSWNHTPSVDRTRGVLVFTFTNANADDATAVSYAGVSLSAVSGGRAVDTAGEAGDCKAWFVGRDIPTANAPGFSTNSVRAVAYANGLWVAVGDAGTIRYASDPSGTWTAASSPGFGANNVRAVAYGGGYWVACGANGTLRYATDPTGTWTAASSPGFGTDQIQGVAYSGSHWIAVAGASAQVRYATDPTGTWTAVASTTLGADVRCVAYGNGYWVAGSSNGVLNYAVDPTGAWSAPASESFTQVQGVSYANGTWVGVGGGGVICCTTDPTGTWAAASSPGFGTVQIYNAAYGNGYWVAGGDSGNLRYATDPTATWSAVANAGSTASMIGVGYDGTHWVVTGTAGTVRYAENPTGTWFGATMPVIVTRTNNADVMYAVALTLTGNQDLAVNTGGIALFSTDGTCAEQSISDGAAAYSNSMRFAGINSGLSGIVDNPASPGANSLSRGTNSTALQSIDFGARTIMVVRETTAGTGSRSVGFSATTSDDRAAVHLAVYELRGSMPPPLVRPTFTVRRKVI